MKLGIMQPYFFPYIGYFQLIQATEQYIFFDTPQYERRSWMNRNRIINPDGEFTYISVPVVKAPQKTPLNEILINDSEKWCDKIFSQLEIYKKRAPYYSDTIHFLEDFFSKKYTYLSEISIESVVRTYEYLGLQMNWDIFSKMQLGIRDDCAPDEWALEICRAMNADTYINAPGGRTFFDASKYRDADILLEFLLPEITPYVQRLGKFVPGLSIIDVMMFNPKEEIVNMLSRYALTDETQTTEVVV